MFSCEFKNQMRIYFVLLQLILGVCGRSLTVDFTEFDVTISNLASMELQWIRRLLFRYL